MGSSGKKRTTRAKLNREGKLREKRVEKQARKAARKLFATHDVTEPASQPSELGIVSPGLAGGGPGGGGQASVVLPSNLAGGEL